MNKLLLSLALLLTSNFSFAQNYSGGSGTAVDPYVISNKNDLAYLSFQFNDWNKHFIQNADIYFTSADFQPGGNFYNSGAGFLAIGRVPYFNGSYNGQMHIIDSLKINSSYEDAGFFSTVYGGQISNLGITNCSFKSYYSTGGIAGSVYNGAISNCYSTGSWIMNYSSGSTYGGLLGIANAASINNCFSTVSIITDTVPAASPGMIGGLIGGAQGCTINNCYARGNVAGYENIGGFAGGFDNSNILNCYSTGNVIYSKIGATFLGTLFGGFVAYSATSNISNCYWDTQTSGLITSAGGGTGLTTAQMQTQSSFTGWDFVGETTNGTNDHWRMGNCITGNNYPELTWQLFSNGGDGTINYPFVIANKNDLKTLSENECLWDKHFVQTADIVIDALDYGTDGIFNFFSGVKPIGNDTTNFTGFYNGNGHIIKGLYFQNPSYLNGGLFGVIGSAGSVTKLGIVDGFIVATKSNGVLCSRNEGTISECFTTGAVFASDYAGGLIAENSGIVTNCYSKAIIISTVPIKPNTDNLPFLSRFDSKTSAILGEGQGGLVGFNSGSISNCYATGSIDMSSIKRGGLIGDSTSGVLSPTQNSFWDTLTSTLNISNGGTGLTTYSMLTQTTYTSAGWDFIGETANGINDIWKMGECANNGYPVFSWQVTTPRPVISSSIGNSNCGAGSLNLNASTSSGIISWYNYVDSVGGVSIDTAATYTTPILYATTNYWAEAIDSAGCVSFPRTIVTAIINPTPDSTTTLGGNGIVIASNTIPQSGTTYQWVDCNNGNAPLAGETNQTFTATANGNYAVVVTVGTCSSTSSCTNITTVGLQNKSNAIALTVMPNPSNGLFAVNLGANATIEVIDVLGRVIINKQKNASNFVIDLTNEENGVYMLHISNNENSKVIRLVKSN